MLTVKGAASAIEFYTRAFGATEVMRITSPQGAVVARDPGDRERHLFDRIERSSRPVDSETTEV